MFFSPLYHIHLTIPHRLSHNIFCNTLHSTCLTIKRFSSLTVASASCQPAGVQVLTQTRLAKVLQTSHFLHLTSPPLARMSSSDDDRPLANTHKANGVTNGTLLSCRYQMSDMKLAGALIAHAALSTLDCLSSLPHLTLRNHLYSHSSFQDILPSRKALSPRASTRKWTRQTRQPLTQHQAFPSGTVQSKRWRLMGRYLMAMQTESGKPVAAWAT